MSKGSKKGRAAEWADRLFDEQSGLRDVGEAYAAGWSALSRDLDAAWKQLTARVQAWFDDQKGATQEVVQHANGLMQRLNQRAIDLTRFSRGKASAFRSTGNPRDLAAEAASTRASLDAVDWPSARDVLVMLIDEVMAPEEDLPDVDDVEEDAPSLELVDEPADELDDDELPELDASERSA